MHWWSCDFCKKNQRFLGGEIEGRSRSKVLERPFGLSCFMFCRSIWTPNSTSVAKDLTGPRGESVFEIYNGGVKNGGD